MRSQKRTYASDNAKNPIVSVTKIRSCMCTSCKAPVFEYHARKIFAAYAPAVIRNIRFTPCAYLTFVRVEASGSWVTRFGSVKWMVRRKVTTLVDLLLLGACSETTRSREAGRTVLPCPDRFPKLEEGVRARPRSSPQSSAKNTIINSAPRLEIPTNTISGIHPASGSAGRNRTFRLRWFYWICAGVMAG